MARPPARLALGALLACSPGADPAPPCAGALDDGVACTADRCDPATGVVAHLPDDAACPPGQTCSPALGCLAAAGCEDLPRVAGTAIRLEPLALGAFASPLVDLAAPAGDARRLFLVEQVGRVWLAVDGQRLATPYLDLTGRVASGGERGLLSLAFHPGFASNGRFYLNYTARAGDGDVRISEFTAPDPAGTSADPASEVVLLAVEHSTYPNHNGGRVAFGPDGYLYASVGDGGGGGDPLGSGQDTGSLLGKLLRIDAADPAAPVPGNPFGTPVYHWGLRNPWRYSFDRQSGDLYIGDVGQDSWEEVDFLAAAGAGLAPPAGVNWGWNVMEGSRCSGAGSCDQTGLAPPVLEYDHGQGCSITGGFVYRGVIMPDLAASRTYFYADYCGGWVRSAQVAGGVATNPLQPFSGLGNIYSFGEDGCGELYLLATGGAVWRLAPAP
ncbi:MAG TPA: PQQ-dependent sugar dehydrogenase [Anaeromyxobacteraceae bacterium]|nr:PQQ-dependent sugar dehydrogenase [Anaeromyxobacteraceae bacterium]